MTNTTSRRTLAVLLAAAAVSGAAVAATATPASDGSISAVPAQPGEYATHTVTLTAGNQTAGSLNGIAVGYANESADARAVDAENVTKVGIDRGDDAGGTYIDVSVADDMSDVKLSNEERTLAVKFSGNYNVRAGDEIVLVYEGVENTEVAGEYTVRLDVNPQSSGGETTATLDIDSTEDQTTIKTTEDDPPADDGTTTEDSTTPDDTSTSGDGTTPDDGATTDDSTEDGDTTSSGDGTRDDTTRTESPTADDQGGDGSDGADGGTTGDQATGGDGGSTGSVPGFEVGVALVAVFGGLLFALRE